jgi:RNA recognition motif-containing protein
MPFSVTQKQLTELFSEYGQILEVLILKDERTGMPKGQGKILFE